MNTALEVGARSWAEIKTSELKIITGYLGAQFDQLTAQMGLPWAQAGYLSAQAGPLLTLTSPLGGPIGQFGGQTSLFWAQMGPLGAQTGQQSSNRPTQS